MESSSFTENRRWAEASPLDTGACEAKQKLRFNFEEEAPSLAESASQSDFTNLISSLVTTNRLLQDEIKQIKKDHRRTLKTLTHCCRLKSEENMTADHNPRGILKNNPKMSTCKESKKVCKSCSAKENGSRKIKKLATTGGARKKEQELTEVTSYSSSCDPESEDEDRSSDYDSTVDDSPSPGMERVSPDRADHSTSHESPGLDAIKSMWNNFSLKDYDFVTLVDGPIVKTKHSSHRSRKYTVPEPFNMTVRESPKKHKCSESSQQVADDHQPEMRVQPVKVPPSTLMPIYELMRAKDEQKREERRKEVMNKLKSTVKPFSFEARESHKQDRREEQMRLEEEVNHLKPKSFKARRVPSKLFDPEVKERMLEEEDYRRIRRRMRSHELLSNSKLPNRMHKSAQQSNKSDREKTDEEEHWFHPKITHEIPDYEEGYSKLRNKLAERKRSKTLTIPQPFKLRTDAICQRRQHKLSTKDNHDEDMKAKRTHSASKLYRHPSLPAHTTQSQQLRQKKVQEMKSMLQLQEMEEEEKLRTKKMERQMMKKIVKEAADKMYSSTLELEEKRKKQADDRRRQEKMNSRKFQRELQEIDERVAARPLLLENSGRHVHKQERPNEFYSYALQKAGFSNKEIKKFLDSLQKEKSFTSDEQVTD